MSREYLKILAKIPRLRKVITEPRVKGKLTPQNQCLGLLQMICENLPEESTVVELGSGYGVSTEVFALTCKEVITYDIWKERSFGERLRKYSNVTQKISNSIYAFNFHEDNSIPVIYLDTIHSRDHVINEIKLWLPKVKTPGGFISGHDFGYVGDYVKEVLKEPDKVYEDGSWIIGF